MTKLTPEQKRTKCLVRDARGRVTMARHELSRIDDALRTHSLTLEDDVGDGECGLEGRLAQLSEEIAKLGILIGRIAPDKGYEEFKRSP